MLPDGVALRLILGDAGRMGGLWLSSLSLDSSLIPAPNSKPEPTNPCSLLRLPKPLSGSKLGDAALACSPKPRLSEQRIKNNELGGFRRLRDQDHAGVQRKNEAGAPQEVPVSFTRVLRFGSALNRKP